MEYLFTKKIYWEIRGKIDKLKFRIDKTLFGGKVLYEETKDQTSIICEIIKSAFPSVIGSAVFVWILYLLDAELSAPLKEYLGQTTVLHFYKIIVHANWLPLVLKVVYQINSALLTDTYRDVITIIISVVGIYIGIYYTTISLLANSSMERFPNALKRVLVEERVNNTYIKFLTFVLSIAFLNFLLKFIAGYNLFLNFIPLSILSMIAIYAFIVLGKRVFYFLDPNTILLYIMKDVYRYTKNGVISKSKHLVAHFQKLVEEKISLIAPLNLLIKQNSLVSAIDLELMSKQLLTFLIIYTNDLKNLVTEDSHWFRRKYKHDKWYLTDWSKEEIAINAKISLTPNEVPDKYWLEDIVFDQIIDTLNTLVQSKDYLQAINILSMLSEYLSVLARNLDHEALQKRFNQLKVVFSLEKIKSLYEGIRDSEPNKLALADGFIDMYPFIIINTFIGLFKTFEVDEINKRKLIIKSLMKLKKGLIYGSRLNGAEIKALDSLYKRLLFEKKVEGKILSPQNSLSKELFDPYSIELEKTLTVLNHIVDNFLDEFIPGLFAHSRYRDISITILRVLELHSKIQGNLGKLTEFLGELEKYTSEYGVKITTDIMLKKVLEQDEKVFLMMSKIIPFLNPEDNNLVPDYFGEAFTFLYFKCFDYLLNNDLERFEISFKALFPAAIKIFSNMSRNLINNKSANENRFKLLSQPLIEMFRLSGYAVISSKVYKNDKFEALVKDIWNRYIGTGDEGILKRNTLVMIYSNFKNTFGIMLRDTIKFNLTNRYRAKLIELNILDQNFDKYSYQFSSITEPVKHNDSMIKAWAKNLDFVDSEDVFIYTMFKKYITDNKIKIHAIDELHDLIEREQNEKTK